MSPAFVMFIKEYWGEMLLVGVCGVLSAVCAVKTIEVASLKTDLASAQHRTTQMQLDAERTAGNLTAQIVKNQAAHARGQAEQENRYAEQLQRQVAARDADRRELDRLRGTIKAYAAGGRAAGGDDASANVGDQDRLDRLATLLDEGVELALEGRGVVERRDAEVKRLLDQITLDRASCNVKQTD